MTHYNIYGLGAALIDTELEVNDQQLADANIEKGMMTLIDAERRSDLLKIFDQSINAAKKASGGSAGNTIIAASYFGANCFFSSKVSSDENGALYQQDMRNAKVSLPSVTLEDGITGKCLVMITPDAERSMNTYLGISESFSERELDIDAISNSDILYLESYLVTSPTCKDAAIKARQAANRSNKKVAISFSDPGIISYFKEGVLEMMGDSVDIIFCNHEEALAFSNTDNLEEAKKILAECSAQSVITLGADGAIVIYKENEEIVETAIKGFNVKAIDTNGAGDMFAGAYLAAISQGKTVSEAGHFASYCASQVVSQYGPRLRPEQHQEILDAEQWK